MTIVGCDLHTRKQQVAVLHTDTGEIVEQELLHAGDAVEQFYRTLPRPVTVGIESTGYALWFHNCAIAPGPRPAPKGSVACDNALDAATVLMDRSPDPPAAGATGGS